MPSNNTDVDDRERRLRRRHRFWEYRWLIALTLVAIFVLGGWVSYGVYAEPSETTEQRLESSWTVTGEFHHQAPVVDSSTVFDDVDTLGDEPRYYTDVSPTAEGTFVTGYEADQGENVTLSLVFDLYYRAVDTDGDMVYWDESERLETVTETDVTPGEEVALTAELNITAIEDRIDDIHDDLGASPGETEVEVVVVREIEGTIDGEEYAETDTLSIPVELADSMYWFEEESEYDAVFESERTETVAADVGPLERVGGPLALVVGAVGLIGIAVASFRFPEPTSTEREWLSYREDRETFEEVIVTATLPENALAESRATVDSLATLCELGITVGEVIVHDRQTELYIVDSDPQYVYEPPSYRPDTDGMDSESATGSADTEPASVLSLPESESSITAGTASSPALEAEDPVEPESRAGDVVAESDVELGFVSEMTAHTPFDVEATDTQDSPLLEETADGEPIDLSGSAVPSDRWTQW